LTDLLRERGAGVAAIRVGIKISSVFRALEDLGFTVAMDFATVTGAFAGRLFFKGTEGRAEKLKLSAGVKAAVSSSSGVSQAKGSKAS
jgi:hypothetical protein